MASGALHTRIEGAYLREPDYLSVAFAAFALVLIIVFAYTLGPLYTVGALGLASIPLVLLRPQTTLWYAPAFILLAVAIAPQPLPAPGETETQPELYAWAVGLFLVSAAAAIRLIWVWLHSTNKTAIPPLGLKLLLASAVAAALQAVRLGAEPSYVLRQLFGILLFCLYFQLAVQFTNTDMDVSRIIRRVIIVCLPVCVFTTVYYLDVWGTLGFYKRHVAIYGITLALYCIGQVLSPRRLVEKFFWIVPIIGFAVYALIFRSRAASGLFVIVALFGLGLQFDSKPMRMASLCGAALFLALAIYGNIFAPLSRVLPSIGPTMSLIPEDVVADPSFQGRQAQFLSAVEILRAHPVLGLGLGSTLEFSNPTLPNIEAYAFVDQGYAYLISKFGLAGLISFVWLVVNIVRRSGWPRSGVHLGLFLIFVFNILYLAFAPIFFQFIWAPWVGITAGFLYRLREKPAAATGFGRTR